MENNNIVSSLLIRSMTEISIMKDRLTREKTQGIYISDLGDMSALRIEGPKIGRELQFYAVCWEKQTLVARHDWIKGM